MAQSLSAKKRIRQNVKRRGRNRWRKRQIKDAVKAFDETLHEGDAEKAANLLKQCYRQIDKVAAKGTIHKNAAARQKARLTRRLNKLTAR
ncbi:MAG: 30S ribosomal protein S20 [Planctomycetota bacterium]